MKPTRFQGRLWLLTGPDGELLDDIDTDMIFHNAHLAITDEAEMGPFALGNLAGWKHFAAEVQPGDMVAAGANFGAGSSRQHAVDCFRALGVSALPLVRCDILAQRRQCRLPAAGLGATRWPAAGTPRPCGCGHAGRYHRQR